jgi:hypothetical protein
MSSSLAPRAAIVIERLHESTGENYRYEFGQHYAPNLRIPILDRGLVSTT